MNTNNINQVGEFLTSEISQDLFNVVVISIGLDCLDSSSLSAHEKSEIERLIEQDDSKTLYKHGAFRKFITNLQNPKEYLKSLLTTNLARQ